MICEFGINHQGGDCLVLASGAVRWAHGFAGDSQFRIFKMLKSSSLEAVLEHKSCMLCCLQVQAVAALQAGQLLLRGPVEVSRRHRLWNQKVKIKALTLLFQSVDSEHFWECCFEHLMNKGSSSPNGVVYSSF